MREIVIGGAQLGAVQKADSREPGVGSRESGVARMLDLSERGACEGVTLMIFPELALTTFSPAGTWRIRLR